MVQFNRIVKPPFLCPAHRCTMRHIWQGLAQGTKASRPEVTSDPFQPGISEIIDVRTPAEFAKDHIPGAINLPVLCGNERDVVGKKYTEDQFQARKLGASLVSRNISSHIDAHFVDKPQEYTPLIYCWRGGQRSYSLALILSQIGFNVFVLEGGYKHYRKIVRDQLDDVSWCNFKVISGLTGTGKTLILQRLEERGHQIIDFEALANHKGSVLGLRSNERQPAQKKMESRLFECLSSLDRTKPVWVESESAKIGQCTIPLAMFRRICTGQRLEIILPLEERVKYIVKDYHYMLCDKMKLIDIVMKLKRHHGEKVVDKWVQYIGEEKWEELVGELMTVHYDPLYTKSQKSHNKSDLSTIQIPLMDLSDSSIENAIEKMIKSIL